MLFNLHAGSEEQHVPSQNNQRTAGILYRLCKVGYGSYETRQRASRLHRGTDEVYSEPSSGDRYWPSGYFI